MKIDFFSDLTDEIRRLHEQTGLTVPTFEQLRSQDKRSDELKSKVRDYDLCNLLLHFFTVSSRLVPIKKWNVHISSKLKSNTKIKDIVLKLESGKNINPLLSNKVKKLNQARNADLLRSEWGIYHLHFQENRSEDLLFVYFEQNNAYLIDILKHEKPDGSVVTWTNTDLIQIMHDNWPHVIKKYILNTDSKEPILTVENRKALRRNGANTSIVVNDKTEYLPLGGGFSASKHPTKAVIESNFLYFTVKQLQSIVEENYLDIKAALINHTTEPNLQLKLDENLKPIVVEVNKNILLDLKINPEHA